MKASLTGCFSSALGDRGDCGEVGKGSVVVVRKGGRLSVRGSLGLEAVAGFGWQRLRLRIRIAAPA